VSIARRLKSLERKNQSVGADILLALAKPIEVSVRPRLVLYHHAIAIGILIRLP
jgi:hypothetical protein